MTNSSLGWASFRSALCRTGFNVCFLSAASHGGSATHQSYPDSYKRDTWPGWGCRWGGLFGRSLFKFKIPGHVVPNLVICLENYSGIEASALHRHRHPICLGRFASCQPSVQFCCLAMGCIVGFWAKHLGISRVRFPNDLCSHSTKPKAWEQLQDPKKFAEMCGSHDVLAQPIHPVKHSCMPWAELCNKINKQTANENVVVYICNSLKCESLAPTQHFVDSCQHQTNTQSRSQNYNRSVPKHSASNRIRGGGWFFCNDIHTFENRVLPMIRSCTARPSTYPSFRGLTFWASPC